MFWLLFLLGICFAEEPSMTIEVVASANIEVYVAPIKINVATNLENIEAEIDSSQAFAYSSRFWRNAKVKNKRGAYEPVTMQHDRIYVYSQDTIQYAWEDCNYKLKPMECSMQNGHYYLETTVHVDDNELVVRAMLFDPYAQVIAVGSSSDTKIIKWIKQQEVKQQQVPQVQTQLQPAGQPPCLPGAICPQSNILIPNTPTTGSVVEQPKEELPLQWTIPVSYTHLTLPTTPYV